MSSVLEHLDEDPRLAAAVRAGAAGRRLLRVLIASGAPVDMLDAAAEELDRLATTLEPYATRSRYPATAEGTVVRLRDPAIAAHHPLLGAANPIAPPLVSEQHDDGSVTLRGAYDNRAEGMPGLVHGGILAMGFDLVLGIASARTIERPAMTGTLTLRYRSPTPLYEGVVYRAVGERRSERTVLTHGTLHVGDRLCVEAQGIWVVPRDTTLGRVEVGE